jgi:hypothetical protein
MQAVNDVGEPGAGEPHDFTRRAGVRNGAPWPGPSKWDNPAGNRGHQGFGTYSQTGPPRQLPTPTHSGARDNGPVPAGPLLLLGRRGSSSSRLDALWRGWEASLMTEPAAAPTWITLAVALLVLVGIYAELLSAIRVSSTESAQGTSAVLDKFDTALLAAYPTLREHLKVSRAIFLPDSGQKFTDDDYFKVIEWMNTDVTFRPSGQPPQLPLDPS